MEANAFQVGVIGREVDDANSLGLAFQTLQACLQDQGWKFWPCHHLGTFLDITERPQDRFVVKPDRSYCTCKNQLPDLMEIGNILLTMRFKSQGKRVFASCGNEVVRLRCEVGIFSCRPAERWKK